MMNNKTHMEDKAFFVTLARKLWRIVLRLRFVLFQRHRYNRLVLEKVAGFPVIVLPMVFNPRLFRSGEFLARNLSERLIPMGSKVLDMGTGSGIGAISAAHWTNRVTAADINPSAVRCATINMMLNGVEDQVKVIESDLFASLCEERFDVILFNPPFYLGTPKDPLDKAWRSNDVFERFASQLSSRLEPNGYGLVVFSTDGELKKLLSVFSAHGLEAELIAQQDMINEIQLMYRITPMRGVTGQ